MLPCHFIFSTLFECYTLSLKKKERYYNLKQTSVTEPELRQTRWQLPRMVHGNLENTLEKLMLLG